MEKTERTRLIYAIILGVFTVAVGVAIICVAADIYYSGKGTGVIYTREIAAKRIQALAIPVLCLIAAIVAGAIFPLYKTVAKRKSEDGVRLLQRKQRTAGEGEEYQKAERAYKETTTERLIFWIVALAVVLAMAIVILCYLCKTANFAAADITKEILRLVAVVLPCSAQAAAALIVAAVYNGVLADRQVKELKAMLKEGKNGTAVASEPWIVSAGQTVAAVSKQILSHNITVWVLRGVLFALAVTFIIVGALNGGAHDVLVKAINICTECIGLG